MLGLRFFALLISTSVRYPEDCNRGGGHIRDSHPLNTGKEPALNERSESSGGAASERLIPIRTNPKDGPAPRKQPRETA
jgi:hypothetical protein